MLNVNEMVKKLNYLYDYGEIEYQIDLQYLIDLRFIVNLEDRIIITKKWIKFTGSVNREDFISSLLCYPPKMLHSLLLKIYKEACIIGGSGDGASLYEFINNIPRFSDLICNIKDEQFIEDEEIKTFYLSVFKGYPQYTSILYKLRLMQLAEETIDSEITPMAIFPNEIWVSGRRVSSTTDLKPLNTKNKYVLTPYEYSDFKVETEIQEVLSYPFKTFLTILCLIALEYQTAGFSGLSIRPTDHTNYYIPQPLDFYIFNTKGREILIGRLNDFVYEFCLKQNILFFPDKTPEVDTVVFEMMSEHKLSFKDGEYVINEKFKDLIYAKDIAIKNRSRIFKNILKEYIEKLRNTL